MILSQKSSSFKITSHFISYVNLSPNHRVGAFTTLHPDGWENPPEKIAHQPAAPLKYLSSEDLSALNLQAIPLERIVMAQQTHSNHVRYVTEPGYYRDTDGFFTDVPGLYLIIRTADCAAVMINFPEVPAIGIAHAGWRGLHRRIVPRVIRAMQERWPVPGSGIRVAVSPMIRKCCYRVGEDLRVVFAEPFFTRRGGADFLDLEGVLREQLAALEIPEKHISFAPFCTACSGMGLLSFRKHKTDRRMVNAVYIKGEPL